MTAVVRHKTLTKLIALNDYLVKKHIEVITPDQVMPIISVNRRTAYDYINTLLYIKAVGGGLFRDDSGLRTKISRPNRPIRKIV